MEQLFQELNKLDKKQGAVRREMLMMKHHNKKSENSKPYKVLIKRDDYCNRKRDEILSDPIVKEAYGKYVDKTHLREELDETT